MRRLLVLALGLLAALGLYALTNAKENPAKTGGPYYYSSFKTKTIPEVPTGEISESEAKANAQRAAYYVAYFDNGARLTRLEKFLGGTLDWKSEYVYDPSGRLLEGTHTDADGNRTLYQFDPSGKIAKKSELKSAKP